MPAARLPTEASIVEPSVPVVPARVRPVAGGLLRVTVEIGDRKYDEDLATQASITPNIEALNDALATNPARYAEWAMLEALAREELDALIGNVDSIDVDIKEREARAYLDVLTPPEDAPPSWKPPTVDAIKATVIIDPQRLALVAARRKLEAARIEAKSAVEKVAVGRKTMERQQDSLLSLATNWRQEMQTQLSVTASRYRPGS